MKRAPQTMCWKEVVLSAVRELGWWDEIEINFYSIYRLDAMTPLSCWEKIR